jgi:hypothetical protein
MKNATARPVVPNLEPVAFAPEKGVRDARFSFAKRPLTTRSKRPRLSEAELPYIGDLFKNAFDDGIQDGVILNPWIEGFAKGGAFSLSGERNDDRQDQA